MLMNYLKFTQTVAQISPAVWDVVSSLEQICIASGMQYMALELPKAFFSISILKTDQKVHVHSDQTTVYIYCLV